MKDDVKISIIVPIYMDESFLHQCLDSIVNQTYENIEIILVDDGSPDHCGEICDEYAKKDRRIIVIHQENAGVSNARNKALDVATGDYVAFVDADDWIEQEMLGTMLQVMLEQNVDIVICGVNYCTEDGEYIQSGLSRNAVLDREELLSDLYNMPRAIGGGCCNKIFSKSLIDKERFRNDLKREEDVIFLFDCLSKCNLGYQMAECFYNIREQSGSATRTPDVRKIYKSILGGKSLRIMYLKGIKYSKKLKVKATDKYLDDCLRYANLIKKIGKETGKPYRWMYLKMKMQMVGVLTKAFLLKLLPKEKIHRYVYEFFVGVIRR